jgi:hypothetical protein
MLLIKDTPRDVKVNPGGKLPVSLALSAGELAIFYKRLPGRRDLESVRGPGWFALLSYAAKGRRPRTPRGITALMVSSEMT